MAPPGGGEAVVTVDFWHPQTTENQDVLQKIVADFNASQTKYRVNEIYIGDYTRLYEKLVTSIAAKQLPPLAVAYESMVAEYMKAGAVRELDDLLRDPEIGFTKEELDDFFPVFLETNRFPQFGNKMLSFPFTKSILMLYYNRGMLKEAGFDGPPETWRRGNHKRPDYG